MLITLYNPTGEGGHQGGGVAAPLGGQILSEVLPYLEVKQGNPDEVEQINQIETPSLIGKTIEEAEKICKENKLQIKVEGAQNEGIDKSKIVVNQIPQSGIMVKENSCIYIEQ
ncbi:PASTA domain protein [compost metagenome]